MKFFVNNQKMGQNNKYFAFLEGKLGNLGKFKLLLDLRTKVGQSRSFTFAKKRVKFENLSDFWQKTTY